MKKILCFTYATFLFALGCSSTEKKSDPMSAPSEVESQPTPTPAPAASNLSVQPCAKYGSSINFNDQRIVSFQKLVQLQILRIKALPMTEESTQELAKLESLRRRVSYPLLTSSLRPKVVSQILLRESEDFLKLLDIRNQTDTQAKSLHEEITLRFIPLIENQDHWNCVERQTDFQEDSSEKTE